LPQLRNSVVTCMKTHKTRYWQIKIPDDWQVESDPDCEILYQQDGPGELHISAVHMDQDVDDQTLQDMAGDHIQSGADAEDVDLGQFDGLFLDYESKGEYWREWYLRRGPLLLYVSYACELKHEGEEDDVVEMMLESLCVV